MFKGLQYKLYPTKSQVLLLEQTIETHRQLYNSALEWKRNTWENRKKNISITDLQKQLTKVHKFDVHLAQTNMASCQQTLRKLDKTFQNFFRRCKKGETPGYPRFKNINSFNSISFTYGNGCKIKNKKLYLQYIDNIRIKWYQDLPENNKIKAITIKRIAGNYYVIFLCELPNPVITQSTNPPIGIDLGLKDFYTDSNGVKIETCKYFKKSQKKLRILQRTLARRKKNSKRRTKAKLQVAKLQYHIANQRKDFHHKTARNLVNNYGTIVLEDLNIQALSKSILSKSFNDAGMGNFINILKYKAENAGVRVIQVNPKNTTQACSACGCLPSVKIKLSDRTYHCGHCEFTLDRDWNAAINILNLAWTEPSDVNVEVFNSSVV